MSPKSTKPVEQAPEAELSALDRLYLDNEPDEHEEKRHDTRTHVVRTGELEVGGDKFACFIVDLSRKGTKIRTLEPLEAELSLVKLHIAEIGVFEAEVRWVNGVEIGLLLHQEIEAPEDLESVNIEDVLRMQNRE